MLGLTSAMSRVARTASNLATTFFFVLPFPFFEKVVIWSDQCAYKNWAVEKHGTDRDGNKKKVRHFEETPPVAERARRKKRHRHRADKGKTKFTITTGYVLCWFAALILQGVIVGDSDSKPT